MEGRGEDQANEENRKADSIPDHVLKVILTAEGKANHGKDANGHQYRNRSDGFNPWLRWPHQLGEKGGAPYSEKGPDIQAKVGEVFTLRLEANETTGYTWRGNERFDRSYLELTDSLYQPTQSQRPGSGGEQHYHFMAVKAGITEIRLTYKRSWETTPSDKTVVFIVRISNP